MRYGIYGSQGDVPALCEALALSGPDLDRHCVDIVTDTISKMYKKEVSHIQLNRQ